MRTQKKKRGTGKGGWKGTELVEVCCKSVWGPEASAVPLQFAEVEGN